jgi:hypothetical protein
MKRKKLSRRERALIQHAIRRYERKTQLRIWIAGCKHPFTSLSLWQLRTLNQLTGYPDGLALFYSEGTKIAL